MLIRELPTIIHEKETQNKILDSATKLFALKGVVNVFMGDIADDVGIKASSIYHHYKGKDVLLKDVLYRFERGYKNYFDSLNDINKNIKTLDELMDNLFNSEFLEMRDPMGCFGMSVVIREQHNNEYARKIVFDLFHGHSIKSMKASFDSLIQKGIIPPSDTQTIATFFMHNVIVTNDLRIHEYKGLSAPIDSTTVYNDMKRFIATALKKGI